MSDQTPPSDASDPSASVDQPPSAIVGTPPASPPAKRKAPAASIIAIVFILVAAGAVSWVLLQLRSDTSTGATPSHPPTAPATSQSSEALLSTVAFDPVQNLAAPQSVTVLGLWSGVAVVSLEYPVDPAQPLHITSILRGIDIATGEILWTYDSLPDGSAYVAGQAMASGDELIMVLYTKTSAANWLSSSYNGFDGTWAIALNLRSGIELSSHFLEPQATGTGMTASFTTEEITAYQDGIVVMTYYSSHLVSEGRSQTKTLAYQDTDLTTPLWQVSGLQANGDIISGWSISSPVLAGGYVKAVSGDYVGIHDGQPSGMSATSTDTQTLRAFFSDGSVILTATGDNSQEQTYTSLAAWDPQTNSSSWEKKDLALNFWQAPCFTGDTFITVDSQNIDQGSSYTTIPELTGISLSTGEALWTNADLQVDSNAGCSPLDIGQDSFILWKLTYTADSGAARPGQRLLDPATGQVISTGQVNSFYPCGTGDLCSAIQLEDLPGTGETPLTPISMAFAQLRWDRPNLTTIQSERLTPLWLTGTLPDFYAAPDLDRQAVFPTDRGLVVVCVTDGQYSFATL